MGARWGKGRGGVRDGVGHGERSRESLWAQLEAG